MHIRKSISTKVKLILIVLISVVLFEEAYLISSQKEQFNTSGKNADMYKSCNEFKNLGSKQQCWERLIENTLNQEGLDSAFNLVGHLYGNEKEFAADCHGFAHELGEKAYQLFSQKKDFKLTSKTSYCGFGFYHAFMETLIQSTNDLSKAREFCDYVGAGQSELARLSCFHGIGHGLLEDIPNPQIEGTAGEIIEEPLAICIKLSNSEVEIYRCASGVFNVLAIYYGNPKSGLLVQKNDPYLICQSQARLSFKESCYDQMNSLVLFSLGQGDLFKAAKFAEDIKEDSFARAAMHGLAGAYGQANVGKIDYSEVVRACQKLHLRIRHACLEGFLLGMLEGGQPGVEYVEGAKFCNSESLEEGEKKECFNNLVWNVSATNPNKLVEVCNNLEPKYQQNCNSAPN